MPVIACSACGSTSCESTGGEAPGFSTVVDGEEFVQPEYSVRECENCGLLYRDRTLSPDNFNRYYAKADFRRWEVAGFYPTERCVLKILRQLPKGSRILDYGCSSGRLLGPLCGDYRCYGVEVNAAAASEATKKGIKILAAEDIESARETEFDAVVLVDLFEHLPKALDLLQKLSRRLVKGGALIIVTGNGDAPTCRRDPAQFWYFRVIEHVCMLTRKHAEFICSRLNLRLDQWIELCHYDSTLSERARQRLQTFVYWQFRNNTLLARSVLRFIPRIRRARNWKIMPHYSLSRDHAVAIFQA
jgi:SAM-dependent methyltransferase